AKTAKTVGADLLILTASVSSELTGISDADVYFRAPNKNDGENSGSLMGTLFEQALLLFFDQMVLYLKEDPADMRKRHANLE
ncbi:MAG: 6-phospho-3-hexuloisomerase, partial [Clostridia bacterium]|nr:6-phospho-3-hexuloisomerase [Clostridia bacterium]